MKNWTSNKISTVEDVNKFMKFIYEDLELNFHPDDDFNDIVNYETGVKSFNKKDADKFNKLVDDCFKVCENNNLDIYEIALKHHPIINE